MYRSGSVDRRALAQGQSAVLLAEEHCYSDQSFDRSIANLTENYDSYFFTKFDAE